MSLPDALRAQATACASLGSPFMERSLNLLANAWPDHGVIPAKFAGVTGDIGPAGHSLPLRLMGGFHALVLQGKAPELAAVYPPNQATDAALQSALLNALDTHSAFLDTWTDSAPQTNEVRRSAALMPAAHYIANRYGLPFITSELGASAGLNMNFNRFAVQTPNGTLGAKAPIATLIPDWTGPTPEPTEFVITNRAGVDLNPLNAHKSQDADRLLAYLWPDQPERITLTRAAIAAQKSTVDKADAIDWLANRLPQQEDGQLHLIYHTVAWQYFPAAAQTRGTAMIEAAGAKATATKPLAWLSMENDGQAKGAALTLRLWPENQTINLGRACFHGRWIDWQA